MKWSHFKGRPKQPDDSHANKSLRSKKCRSKCARDSVGGRTAPMSEDLCSMIVFKDRRIVATFERPSLAENYREPENICNKNQINESHLPFSAYRRKLTAAFSHKHQYANAFLLWKDDFYCLDEGKNRDCRTLICKSNGISMQNAFSSKSTIDFRGKCGNQQICFWFSA